MDQPIEEVNVLARSPTRIRLFEELYEHEQLAKSDLKQRIDASRTTIQRNLDALQEQGWVAGNNREYWVTRSGKPVAEQFLELLNTIYAAKRIQPFLEWLHMDELDLPLSSLANAEITVTDENNPYAPVNRHIELMQSTDWFRCLLPAVGLQPLLVARDRILKHESRHEIVVDPDIVDTLRTRDAYQDPLGDILSTDRATVLVSDREIPFYLGMAEGVVQIGVSDDDGVPRSLIETGAGEVREWAEETYEEYRTAAEPLLSRQSSASSTL